MDLFRIISLETFIDLLHNKRERYVRPATWKDTFEGYLFSKIYDKDEQRKIAEEIYYNVCDRNYEATSNNMLNLEHAKWFVYGQCWSIHKESDAMWRIYSYENHSIQIQSTKDKIENLFQKEKQINYDILPVEYDVNPDDDITHLQILQMKKTQRMYEPYLHKRKAFMHESETRVLIDDIRWHQVVDLASMGANWKIDEAVQNINDDKGIMDEIIKRLEKHMNQWIKDKMPKEYYVNDIDLESYISSVVVNPFAEDWYVALIKNLCEEYKIKCDGRSHLYERKDKIS